MRWFPKTNGKVLKGNRWSPASLRWGARHQRHPLTLNPRVNLSSLFSRRRPSPTFHPSPPRGRGSTTTAAAAAFRGLGYLSPGGWVHGTVSRRGSPAPREGRPAPSPPHAPAALKPERGRGPGGVGAAGGMALGSRWRPPPQLSLLLLLLALATGVRGLEFGGGPGQWARYARWAGAASSGELSFSLRTNATRALLLYLDDGGDCDFLELLLVDGRLRLRFTLSCAEPATLQLDTPVADDRWHMVLLTRDARRTALAVDGEARAAEVRSKRREMQVASDLFVGGIPPDVRLSALTLSTVKYEPPFRGLLANLKLGERPPALLGSQGLRGAAADPLCAPARNPCANGGLCTVLAPGEVGCDCSHTGFGGKFCSEGESQRRSEMEGWAGRGPPGRVGAGNRGRAPILGPTEPAQVREGRCSSRVVWAWSGAWPG